jgi:hypothetical protein
MSTLLGIVAALVVVYVTIGAVVLWGKPLRRNPDYRPHDDFWGLGGLQRWAARRDAGIRCRSCQALIPRRDRWLGLYELRDHLCEPCLRRELRLHDS